jgi:hypothetical protein
MGFEYLIDLYALSIDEFNIFCKCPFQKSNVIHVFKNDSHSLLNHDLIKDIPCKSNFSNSCSCGTQVVVNVGDYTSRCSYKLNKKKTSYIKIKKSMKKLKLLYELELVGDRSFFYGIEQKKNIRIVTFD